MAYIISPKGIALSPYLNKPNTSFNPLGKYEVTLGLDLHEESTREFLEFLKREHANSAAQAQQENKRKKIKLFELPIEEDHENGKIRVYFMLFAKIKPANREAFTQRPALFDAACRPMRKYIGEGSIIRVAFDPVPFYTPTLGAGLTLRFKAVQVISLIGGSNDGRSFGFIPEEGYLDDGWSSSADEDT